MNRRGFLGGALALLATPAIIRTPGLLMPVSARFQTIKRSMAIITPQQIADEAAWIVASEAGYPILRETIKAGQFHVDLTIDPEDMTLPFSEFSDRFIRPAAAMLAQAKGNLRLVGGLPIPAWGCDAALGRSAPVRFVRVYDPNTGDFVNRFDILTEAA